MDREPRHARGCIRGRRGPQPHLLPDAPPRRRREGPDARGRGHVPCSTLARMSRARDTIASAFRAAADLAAADLGWPAEAKAVPVSVERPGDPTHGDYATSVALRLAKPTRKPPIQIAEAIRDRFPP